MNEQNYSRALDQPVATLMARSFMDGIFRAEEIVNRSLTGQGFGSRPDVRPPVGIFVTNTIAGIIWNMIKIFLKTCDKLNV